MTAPPRVLVTRAAGDAAALSDAVRALGAVPVEAPLLVKEVVPGALLAHRGPFDWLVLTSPGAVDAVDDALSRGWTPPPRVAAVGPGTAARAEALGLVVSLVPDEHTGQALAAALGGLPGGRVLYPRGEEVTPGTPEALRANMQEVVEVVAYRNAAPPDLALRLAATWPFDVAALMSGSAARRLAVGLAAAGLPKVPVVAIGPRTAAGARAVGLEVVGTATTHDQAGLIDALRHWIVRHDATG